MQDGVVLLEVAPLGPGAQGIVALSPAGPGSARRASSASVSADRLVAAPQDEVP